MPGQTLARKQLRILPQKKSLGTQSLRLFPLQDLHCKNLGMKFYHFARNFTPWQDFINSYVSKEHPRNVFFTFLAEKSL